MSCLELVEPIELIELIEEACLAGDITKLTNIKTSEVRSYMNDLSCYTACRLSSMFCTVIVCAICLFNTI